LIGFESKRVDFEVQLTTPSETAMVFNLIWTIVLDALRFLEIAYKCCMTTFPVILALGNAWVHVGFLHSSNENFLH